MPRLSPLLFLAALLLCFSPAQAKQALKTRAPKSGYAAAFRAMDAGQTGPVQAALARGHDPVLNKVLKAYLMSRPGCDYSFDELAGFITDNPDWPNKNGILMIAEQKIPQDATYAQIVNWFNAYPPLLPAGFYRHMEALEAMGNTRIAETLIRNRWVEKDFGSDDLAAFRSRYAPLLRREDHLARIDRLLWKNDIKAARAMYPFVDEDIQDLAEARIALANQSSKGEKLADKVSSSLRRDPGLLFERLRWERRNDNNEAAIEILLNAPDHLGHPDAWWDERHILIRRVMEQKDYPLAYRLAANNGLAEGFELLQAEFLSGWLALRALSRPDLAEHHFKRLIDEATSPVSRARGYYWLGRAYEVKGLKHEAEQAYQSAAALNTTFYGQLAITRLYAQPTLHAVTEPPIPASVRKKFFARDIVRATDKLYAMGQINRAKSFFKATADAATQRVEFALLLEQAYLLKRPDWVVTAAKAAAQKNFLVTGAAFPILDLRLPSQPEKALTHALIRQESLFKADAGSPAGARGLMQLMPGTAKDMARKLGVSYHRRKLTDPDYNVKLGTFFIQRQIDSFDGSYILALAGYNAGPRRVRDWVELFGDPRANEVDPVDWIELIPIYETRNYVQRIIENLQFYRARLNGGQAPLKILEDLRR